MGVIQEFFNNREIAIGIWVIIGLAVILPTKPARQFIKTASVVFAMENPCENGVFKATDIHFSDKSIPAYKFSKPDSDI